MKSDAMPANDVLAADRKHVFHTWSAQAQIKPVPVKGAKGSWFWDYSGKRYLDFASQYVYMNIGHQHPKIVSAVVEQARELCVIAPYHANEARSTAAALIADLAPGELGKVLFTNGGADAVEHAVRMARVSTGRQKVLASYRSYHGASALSISLTGDPRRWPSEPGAFGVVHFVGPYLYRSHFGATSLEEESARALAHLEEVVQFEDPGSIAAIVIESIPGPSGVLVPPPGYLAGVRSLCDKHGIMMIADEVMSGFGRAGEWFAIDHWEVVPDLITFAKGVTSGYVPLGGVILSNGVADYFEERMYPGGLTYSGHPLGCATAVAVIQTMKEEGIVEHARDLGQDVLGPGLRALAARHSSIGEVRGMGVFWALELVRDQDTREMLVPYPAYFGRTEPMKQLVEACHERGVWPYVQGNRLCVVPPCTITKEEIDEGLSILDEVLTLVD